MELWPHIPQGGVIESLEWLTDIIRCKSAEYRLCLRQFPRQTFAFQYQMPEVEYGLAREKARLVGGDSLFVPDWLRLQSMPAIALGATTIPVDTAHASAYKVGGSVLLWEAYDYYEACTISIIGEGTITISATTKSYSNAIAAPLRVCTFMQAFDCDRATAHYNIAKALFLSTTTESMIDAAAIAYPIYLSRYLVISPREAIGSLADNTSREVMLFDSRLDGIVNYAVHATPRTSMSLSITAQTLQERINLRTFLATMCGRWKSFWLPSWNADFILTKDIAASDGYIQISAVNFATTYGVGTDIVVITNVGAYYPMRITSVIVDGSNEKLYSSDVTHDVSRTVIDRVCKLTLSRFDADRIELQYLPGLAMTAVIPTQEIPL